MINLLEYFVLNVRLVLPRGGQTASYGRGVRFARFRCGS